MLYEARLNASSHLTAAPLAKYYWLRNHMLCEVENVSYLNKVRTGHDRARVACTSSCLTCSAFLLLTLYIFSLTGNFTQSYITISTCIWKWHKSSDSHQHNVLQNLEKYFTDLRSVYYCEMEKETFSYRYWICSSPILLAPSKQTFTVNQPSLTLDYTFPYSYKINSIETLNH